MYPQQSQINNTYLYIVCIIIFSNLFFGHGFQLLRIFNLPVNEITLFFLLLLINHFVIFNKLNTITNTLPFIIWIVYGLISIFFSFIEYGIWALRDGTQILDALYLIVGFVLLSKERNVEIFFKTIKISFFVSLVYVFLFPYNSFLINLPPFVFSAAGTGQPVSLFFNYSSLGHTWIWLGFFPLIFSSELRSNFIYKMGSIIMIGISLFVMQRRGIYVAVIGVILFLIYFNRQFLKKTMVYIFLTFLLLFLITLFGIQLEGKLDNATVTFFFKHLISFVPGYAEANPDFRVPAGTANIRILWWTQILEESFTSLKFFLFGKGFGIETVDFYAANEIAVREPHNAFISTYVRMGFLGILIFLWMHIIFFKTWVKFYKYADSNSLITARNRLLYLAIFIVMILAASVGGSTFQKTYKAVPYYFFWGATFGICYNIRNKLNKIDQN